MPFDISNLIVGIRQSRVFFLNHLKGVRDDQWDWKPYPECKSIRETLAHMVNDDHAFVAILRDGKIEDYEAFNEQERDIPRLMEMLRRSHEELCAFIKERFADTPLDTEVGYFTGKTKLGLAITGVSSEDYYHSGQVAFIRMSTDPEWDYYRSIYSEMAG